jgi:hypothetical protein
VVVAGWEYTRESPGHLGVTFVDLRDVRGLAPERRARAALAKGALVAVNHPFFRPVDSDLPVMKLVEGDRRWRPFFAEGADDLQWNAIEVWHQASAVVEKMHARRAAKYPQTQMLRDSLNAWDAATRVQRRRIVAVGGTDAHGRLPYIVSPMPVLSVLAATADEQGLREGLLAGRVTFGAKGGAAARDFAATSDVAGERATVGGSLRAKAEVRLTWTGAARLFEDGTDAGPFDGGATRRVDPPGSFHFWRIELPGDAYSNMVYANL